ncbi:MAG: 30S ribosomal protein S20 [Candidatus Desulforudis sp.]|nr:30S ribosomal protein S20 [Desulforudis sp.]
MAHTRSAKKRIMTISKRTERNRAVKSSLKTTIRRFEEALRGEEQEQARLKLQRALVSIDKAVTKGILHKNTAARKKSHLTRKMNAIG